MNIPFINDFLKRRRKEKGITQEKFADMIFKSKPTIARYDAGDTIPESVLQRSCEVLNLDFLTILKGQEEESLGDYESWEEIDKYNNYALTTQSPYNEYSEYLETYEPPYEKILRKYVNKLKQISLPQPSKKIENDLKEVIQEQNNYNFNIESLKTELLNYLNFKDEFLKIETTEEEKNNKIEKILSFIDFLYFQDIIKK
ncbi:helix-turn-helix domain-containing protein [Fusobacterium sp.]|uniref:helix-turn-helix domain-containing protein n=1 Tax=Fusobacterium sp. TaxID=68766 RepID=UPI002E795657|nr:helix-turn-helix transcriptional regulator [Fusobacterium sp.]MEE1475751.1 helix-turn-helix transcriptional regulator [Fusobacterium sp.]